MALYICNSFSLNMLDREACETTQRFPLPLNLDEAYQRFGDAIEFGDEIISAIGHSDMAVIVSELLAEDIPMCRQTIKLGPDDCALIAQYSGPRLPEGATKLPEGAEIEWWII